MAKNVQVDKSMIRGAEDGLIEDVQSSYRRIHDLERRPGNRTLDMDIYDHGRKINVFEKPILFCKYLHNGSSDPYEILYGGQLVSCELRFNTGTMNPP